MKNIFLFLVFCISASIGISQEKKSNTNADKVKYVLKGRVKDAKTKKNVYDATVVLKSDQGQEEVVKTSKSGKYIFDTKKPLNTPYLKPNSTYQIVVKKEGYKDASSQESTSSDEQETITLDFLLEPIPTNE